MPIKTRAAVQQCSTGLGDARLAALESKVGQLESVLQQKIRELNHSQNEQLRLQTQLDACIQTIQDMSKRLASAGDGLKTSHKQIVGQVKELEQSCQALEASNEGWSKRSIALQFNLLASQDEVKQTKDELDLAISFIALLEMELTVVKAENEQDQDTK
jgi:chromosome segregation ATPase